jgi:glycosyltransferase involved in cell wall biosynthesis
MTEEMRRHLAGIPGIEAVGYVDDLSQVYADSAFAIAPVFSGGGTNIKVLEALWYGRACLVTAVAHRGYQEVLPAGECLEVAYDLDALVEGAVRLYMDPDYRQRLANAGCDAVRRHYSFKQFCRVVEDTVEQVLSG